MELEWNKNTPLFSGDFFSNPLLWEAGSSCVIRWYMCVYVIYISSFALTPLVLSKLKRKNHSCTVLALFVFNICSVCVISIKIIWKLNKRHREASGHLQWWYLQRRIRKEIRGEGAREEVIFLDLLQNLCHNHLSQTLRLFTVCICVYLDIVKASQKSLSDQYQGRWNTLQNCCCAPLTRFLLRCWSTSVSRQGEVVKPAETLLNKWWVTDASSADEEMDRWKVDWKHSSSLAVGNEDAFIRRRGQSRWKWFFWAFYGRLKLPHTARMRELSQRGRNQPICQTEANDTIKLKLHQLQRSPGRHSKGCFCCEMMKISRHMGRESYKVVSWQLCVGICGEKNLA